jgi:hypothetical protein
MYQFLGAWNEGRNDTDFAEQQLEELQMFDTEQSDQLGSCLPSLPPTTTVRRPAPPPPQEPRPWPRLAIKGPTVAPAPAPLHPPPAVAPIAIGRTASDSAPPIPAVRPPLTQPPVARHPDGKGSHRIVEVVLPACTTPHTYQVIDASEDEAPVPTKPLTDPGLL